VPKVAELKSLSPAASHAFTQAVLTHFTRWPSESPKTYASGLCSCPEGSSLRISSVAKRRLDSGASLAVLVLDFSARVTISLRGRLTSFHCTDRISPGQHAVSNMAMMIARR
jgi:hypothetical protein